MFCTCYMLLQSSILGCDDAVAVRATLSPLCVCPWLLRSILVCLVQDGQWGLCADHLTTVDGDNVNNLIVVPDEDLGPEVAAARARIRAPGGELTQGEYEAIRAKLGAMRVDDHSTSAPTEP